MHEPAQVTSLAPTHTDPLQSPHGSAVALGRSDIRVIQARVVPELTLPQTLTLPVPHYPQVSPPGGAPTVVDLHQPVAVREVSSRNPTLPHPSIFVQIDWWCYAVLRERLTHDFCAPTQGTSLCPSWGPLPFRAPASTQFCLFAPRDTAVLCDLVCQVEAERGAGVFVLPAFSKFGSVLPFSDERVFPTLRCYARNLLSFFFQGPNVLASRHTQASSIGWAAFVVSFESAGSGPKRKPSRPEHVVNLVPQLGQLWPSTIGDRAFGPIQVSPQPYVPAREDDTCPTAPDFKVSSVLPAPARTSRWCVEAFESLSASYPFPDVLDIARQTVSGSGLRSSFVGNRSKCVVNPNMVHTQEEIVTLTDLFNKDVSKGLMAGPFSECPFPATWCPLSQPRFAPAGLRLKDRWDPGSLKGYRPIVNHSKHDKASPNGLTYSPRFVRFSLQACHIRDRLAELGPGAQVDVEDLVGAFRMDRTCSEDLHLFVYHIGEFFYADLFHCFGFRPSEWGFAAVSAVILWGLSQPQMGIVSETTFLDIYVDNIKLFSAPGVLDHADRFNKLRNVLLGLGCSLHDRQASPRFRSLGWDYDLTEFKFHCPPEKWLVIRDLLHGMSVKVCAGHPLSSKSLEQMVGFLWWASTAAPAITPLIYVLGSSAAACSGSGRALYLNDRAEYSLLSITLFWESWDRSHSIFHGFSPTHQAQAHIYLDASTVVGCGGWLAESGIGFYHTWTASELEAMVSTGDAAEPALKSRSSTFAELRCLEHALDFFNTQLKGRRVQILFDSECTKKVLRKGYSAKPFLLGIASRVRSTFVCLGIIPHFVFAKRAFNTVADALSNTRVDQAVELALSQHGVQLTKVSRSRTLPDPAALVLPDLRSSFRL